jgi:hypothetical protein
MTHFLNDVSRVTPAVNTASGRRRRRDRNSAMPATRPLTRPRAKSATHVAISETIREAHAGSLRPLLPGAAPARIAHCHEEGPPATGTSRTLRQVGISRRRSSVSPLSARNRRRPRARRETRRRGASRAPDRRRHHHDDDAARPDTPLKDEPHAPAASGAPPPPRIVSTRSWKTRQRRSPSWTSTAPSANRSAARSISSAAEYR